MKNSNEDLALQTLLTVQANIAPEIDEQLLKACYAIQRKHQFNSDRTQSSIAMERLIDEIVNDSDGENK